ncbi:polyprenyl diphosphate synthase [Bacteriovoracaceae bacterium]|nr:polyprenyl diphosphate synthase [Bacteriovoracaceae bacterium]|tara:strand:- start:211986 stop:212756 length:771 start_codon:yes stop_codon:yes gene_type:complete
MSVESKIKHVAIIMDGNGRWANGRSHPRVWGHVRGSSVVSNIVEEADNVGVESLTLYAFSTENWSRPLPEVTTLFKLLKKFLLRERKKIIKNNIQFRVMGDTTNLPEDTKKLINDLTNETENFKGLKLTFAFGYGGRQEIVDAVNSFTKSNPGKMITEEDMSNHLYCPVLGDVDLLIRTGGDQRISNFLLWQMAYAELYFTNTKWPDFTRKEFRQILQNVCSRERRFGQVCESVSLYETSSMADKNKKILESAMGK